MNKHIELVEKWLADRSSVTQEELIANRNFAYAIYAAVADCADAAVNAAAAAAAFAVAYADEAEADDVAAADDAAAVAAHWVKRYHELIKDSGKSS